jgi:malonyl-CoA/methylmalonyl-CoA synthetase
VDVIKSGGHKISALDVEREILANDLIEEVAVMGLSDLVWGQRVFALLVLQQSTKQTFNEREFLKWCKTRLPRYSVPTIVKVVESIPKNQLGKVNKKELIKIYEKQF